jgi:D-serine deaminase-like pyridoxal phosphate-dependent protein
LLPTCLAGRYNAPQELLIEELSSTRAEGDKEAKKKNSLFCFSKKNMEDLLQSIIEPTLLLDEARCRRNIERMAQKAKANHIPLRPHFKTHQSHAVGEWFRDYGVDRIAVSSLRMADYFARAGWEDITNAFPTNIREINRINEITSKTQLNLLVENLTAVQFLEKELKHPVGIFIKADTGYHRTGLGPEDFDLIDQLLAFTSQASKLDLKGFLAHAGHSYGAQGQADIAQVHQSSLDTFQLFHDRYDSQYPDLIYSAGDTPTCSAMDTFPGLSEMRPGNFVFYDLSQWDIGSCALEDIAVAMACPVVAKHPARKEMVVYGGGVHFSKDRRPHPNGPIYYGMQVHWENGNWATHPDNACLKSLSQEHGIVAADTTLLEKTKVGDILCFLPIHSCMTANLMKRYLTLDGEWMDMMAYPGGSS